MIVDDSAGDDVDDDDLDLTEGAAAGGQMTNCVDGAPAGGDGDAPAPAEKKKSVRLAAAGEPGPLSALLYTQRYCHFSGAFGS